MKKLKLSQWHDGSVKPVHVGLYEVGGNGGAYQWWSGKWWGNFCMSKEEAFADKEYKSCWQKEFWRGIVR